MKGGLDDAQLDARELAAGLRVLRAEGLFCDMALMAGNEKLHAHQAVLAAASMPLRQYLTEGCEAEPQPLELQMTGGENPEVLRALLDQAYGAEAGGAAAPGGSSLARGLELKASSSECPQALAAGLRDLRSKGALCDLRLVVGGRGFPAHQAVLAAASMPLRRYILSGLDELLDQRQAPEGEDGGAKARVASEPLELELEGVACGEAARAVLDHVYAAPGGAALPETEAAIKDVLRLANAFELPRLRERAAQWLVVGITAANAPERLSICEEFGFAALGSRIKEVVVEQASPTSTPASARKSAEREERRESPQEAILADPALMSSMTEIECAMLFMSTAQFADESVPDVPGQRTVEAMEKSRTRQDARTLERLYDLFDQRPVWLEASLLKHLPAHTELATLLRLLPCVSYQWKDGPWQMAYARFGWDPRQQPEEAKWLQVIDFRDPALRGAVRPVARGSQASGDCHFRRPPAQRSQHYQLVDIKDDFITELVRGSEPTEECSRRTGWLEQVIYDAARERLTVRSQQLRERQAAKEQAERAKSKAGRRSSADGAGQPRKRARGPWA